MEHPSPSAYAFVLCWVWLLCSIRVALLFVSFYVSDHVCLCVWVLCWRCAYACSSYVYACTRVGRVCVYVRVCAHAVIYATRVSVVCDDALCLWLGVCMCVLRYCMLLIWVSSFSRSWFGLIVLFWCVSCLSEFCFSCTGYCVIVGWVVCVFCFRDVVYSITR